MVTFLFFDSGPFILIFLYFVFSLTPCLQCTSKAAPKQPQNMNLNTLFFIYFVSYVVSGDKLMLTLLYIYIFYSSASVRDSGRCKLIGKSPQSDEDLTRLGGGLTDVKAILERSAHVSG